MHCKTHLTSLESLISRVRARVCVPSLTTRSLTGSMGVPSCSRMSLTSTSASKTTATCGPASTRSATCTVRAARRTSAGNTCVVSRRHTPSDSTGPGVYGGGEVQGGKVHPRKDLPGRRAVKRRVHVAGPGATFRTSGEVSGLGGEVFGEGSSRRPCVAGTSAKLSIRDIRLWRSTPARHATPARPIHLCNATLVARPCGTLRSCHATTIPSFASPQRRPGSAYTLAGRVPDTPIPYSRVDPSNEGLVIPMLEQSSTAPPTRKSA